jgi:hypothetical protein
LEEIHFDKLAAENPRPKSQAHFGSLEAKQLIIRGKKLPLARPCPPANSLCCAKIPFSFEVDRYDERIVARKVERGQRQCCSLVVFVG